MRHKIGLFLIISAGLLPCSVPARAAIIYSIQPVTATVHAGTVGDSLDVLLSNTGPSDIPVAGFSFEVSTADTDIRFTDANTSTASAAYVFGTADSFFGPDLTPGFTPSTILSAVDLSFSGTGTVLHSGGTLALGHVLFSVANTAAGGPFTVSFAGGASLNNLSDPSALNIPIGAFSSGQITVVAIATPEPSSWLLLLAGGALVWGASRLRLGISCNPSA